MEKSVDVMFLDFQKDFNKVTYKKFVHRLEQIENNTQNE